MPASSVISFFFFHIITCRCGVDGVEAPPAAVPRSVPVRVAYELQQAGHRYLDVRYMHQYHIY
jgi:hypothetical protein